MAPAEVDSGCLARGRAGASAADIGGTAESGAGGRRRLQCPARGAKKNCSEWA